MRGMRRGPGMYVEGPDTSTPPQPRCAPQIRTTSVLMQSGHGEGTPPFCAVSPPHAGAVTGWRHERGAFARSPPARALWYTHGRRPVRVSTAGDSHRGAAHAARGGGRVQPFLAVFGAQHSRARAHLPSEFEECIERAGGSEVLGASVHLPGPRRAPHARDRSPTDADMPSLPDEGLHQCS